MLHNLFIGLSWLIGGLGVVGAGAFIAGLVFLGPVALRAIVAPIVEEFFACTKCVAAVVFVLATVGAYWVGHHEAENECRAADLAAALRNAQFDLDNAVKAKADESQRADAIEETSNARHQKDIAANAALALRAASCAFDDIDAGGLPGQSRAGRAKAAARAK